MININTEKELKLIDETGGVLKKPKQKCLKLFNEFYQRKKKLKKI